MEKLLVELINATLCKRPLNEKVFEGATEADCPYSEIDTYGVVSQEIAGQMASHGKNLLNVDYCVSFTGNAGPTAMEGKPVGEVYIG